MAENSTSNSIPKALLALSGVIVFFLVLIPLQAWFFKSQSSEDARKQTAAITNETDRLRTEQLELLRSYRWVDRNKGTVAIPIERAMQAVIAEETAKTVTPAPKS